MVISIHKYLCFKLGFQEGVVYGGGAAVLRKMGSYYGLQEENLKELADDLLLQDFYFIPMNEIKGE